MENKVVRFFYNCTLYPPSLPYIECLRYGLKRSYVFVEGAIPEFDWERYCETTVSVPVINKGGDGILVNSFGRVLQDGFKLTWRSPDRACRSCEASGGFCGYGNGLLQKFICHCNDGQQSDNSCHHNDVEFQASTTINGVSNLGQLYIQQDDNGTKCVDEVIQDNESKRETNGGENGSDSEDDLNIVLNDDDGGGFGGVDLRSGGFDEEEEEGGGFEGGGEGEGLGKNRTCGDQLLVGDALELSESGGGEKGNGSKGRYQSQYLQYKIRSFKMVSNIGLIAMSSITDQAFFDEDSIMDIDRPVEDQEDPFLQFIDYSKSVLSPEEDERKDDSNGPGWSWIVSRILKKCTSYSSGVTSAILLSDICQAWHEQQKIGASRKRPECINQMKKKHKRAKLPNTDTIDSIYENNFLSLNSVLEAVIVDAFLLPGTNIYMITLGDFWSSNTIDLYLHRRFYNLADPNNGILKKGREVFLTGCYLRPAFGGSGYPRLLPTEYLVILLDEDQDDDAMLLGAQFCSDSFSSISFDAVNQGVSYALYARIECIGSLQIQGKSGSLQWKHITLVDIDGARLKFLLWGEQVLLANFFRVGSMLALDRPFVASSVDTAIETGGEICLEYGSATQLYLVPFIQHEEQVSVALTQNRHQGSKLLSVLDASQGLKVSQVTLPCDSQGSVDFSNYPFRTFVVDLRDKMTSISLYGVVKDIIREIDTAEAIFSLRIEDTTGAIWAKLHFVNFWSLGRLGLGHTLYISGLTCSMTKQQRLEVSWFEKDAGASFINLSCFPALLNSPCLHKLSYLSDLSSQTSSTLICQVRLDQIEHCHVNMIFSHAICGQFVSKSPCGTVECNFCRSSCDAEIVRSFHSKITLADESAKVLVWCTGQTAVELLHISPDEFNELHEEEQIMYPSSLENERFTVALVNCRRQGY
ncbi:uncharacterized protein LOC130760587 [Actinidia eriantha]|uniref:uncharacterized protein LOC130760587 n=1 Tax=Actinidia eriantha TaxID=165200 RepID=UPI002583C029|nr:uncharacterized protein LOC130760587 [Actinidia eriantha]